MEIVAVLIALAALACSVVIATIQLKTRHLAMTPRFEFDTVGHTRTRGGKLETFCNPVLTLQNLGPVDYDDVKFESIDCAHGEKQFDALELPSGKFATSGSIGPLAVGETRRMRFDALSTWRTDLDEERAPSFVAGHGRLLVIATKGRRKWTFVPDEIPFRDYLASAIVRCDKCKTFSPVSFSTVSSFQVGRQEVVEQACRSCEALLKAKFTLQEDSLGVPD